jgi:hypothetical protein
MSNISNPPPPQFASIGLSFPLSCLGILIDVPQCVLSKPFLKNPFEICSVNVPWFTTTLFIFHET